MLKAKKLKITNTKKKKKPKNLKKKFGKDAQSALSIVQQKKLLGKNILVMFKN